MAIVSSRSDLNQGQSNAVSDAVFGTGTGADINITSVGSNLPALATNEFFEVRDHSNSQNNGLYQVVTVTTSTSDYECDKVTGSAPVTASSEAITTLGATGVSTEKSVHYDVAGLVLYILEQGNVSADGVTGEAIYSFTNQEYKEDDFIKAAAPYPLRAIDSDAGKFIIGQDPAGNSNGWAWGDDTGFSIRTRKLLRNMGCNEVDANGNTVRRSVGILTLGTFRTPATDTAFYQFGTDTSVDDTVDFDFAGPVNEMVEFFTEIGNPATCDFATSSTITRSAGSFVTDGYKVGGRVTVRNADNAAHNGTWTLTAVAALTLTVSGTPFTGPDPDTNAILAVDNGNAIRVGLRVRDGLPTGNTFSEANLATISKTALSNFVYPFPLANTADLKITETDANIDANTPYTGMSITFHNTPQARAGLVGGSFNFGIIVDGNGGTNIEVFEWVQRQLRLLTDIDADADTAIGRTIGLLARFNGEILEMGSGDGGLTFPTNPDGGGSGVYVDDLNAGSDNFTRFWDNTGTLRQKPESVAVTLDFNAIVINDTEAEYDMYFDRTIRTNVTDFVISTGPDRITSAGTNLPNNAELSVGDYIRVSGLTAGDAPMNGIYQITVENTPGASWDVVRWDGVAIVGVTSTTADVDQNPVESPDAIVVHTNIDLSVNTISFTAPDLIDDSGSGLAVFAVGDFIEVEGSTSGLNDGIYEVATSSAAQLELVEQTITTQGASPTVTITGLFKGLADADVVANFAFDGNVQGGRTVSTDTFVRAIANGVTGSQYIASPVGTISSGTPLTLPLFAGEELNAV